MRTTVLCAIVAAFSTLCALPGNANDLASQFASPPDSARAWCYWWWLDGFVSKAGITRDLEEMKKAGISGALVFDAGEGGPKVPRGPAFMSPEWRECYRHAVREAERLGIVLSVNLCSGWNVGGPWVTQEHAAKKLISSQTTVKGSGHVSVALRKPAAVQDFYRDIAVLATPTPKRPEDGLHASSQYQDYGPALAEDGVDSTRWVSDGDQPGMGPTPQEPEFLQFVFEQPKPATGIYLKPYRDCGPKDVEVLCSDDGQTFRSLARATLKPGEEKEIAFEETRARQFRVLFLSSYPFRGDKSWNVQVAEIRLLTEDPTAKRKPAAPPRWDRARAVDVTKYVNQDGWLEWDVPAGSWEVLRIGYTLLGRMTTAVGSGPAGPEIDPMSAAAMDAHFAETGAKLIADAGPLAGKVVQYFHIDSWELGQPTWTPQMREEFQRRRGCDPLLHLPALLGWAVDDAASTEQFLKDYRRPAADLIADNYYGRLEQLTVQGGLRGTHPEAGGPYFTQWVDALQTLGRTAVPMGEFWSGRHITVKQAANAAHLYGKPLCQAEAFTSVNTCDWTMDPWSMKKSGDAAFCDGLTRTVLCFWVHQPQPDVFPGLAWQHIGTCFNYKLTWWPMAANSWLTHLARCQLMLRQGMFVADYAFLREETIPGFVKYLDHVKAAGFDYDWFNTEVLLTRASAKDGRLALPDGMSYRYLVLPDGHVSQAALQKVGELAEAGVTVIGPNQFEGVVRKMRTGDWHSAGARADALAPDVEHAPGAIQWIHRRDGETDIYFLANQTDTEVAGKLVFRVAGKQPEWWDPQSGAIRNLPDYRGTEDQRTEVAIRFAPRQSWFVVFRKKGSGTGAPGAAKNFPEVKPVMDVEGPWEVSFDPAWFYPDNGAGAKLRFDGLEDWSRRAEDAARYYSGTATYRKVLDLSKIGNPKAPLHLDLGVVKNVARVRLNGVDLGVVWCAPWRVNMAGAWKSGANALEIDVANLWPNRVIGDQTLPKEERRTDTNVWTYETPLPPDEEGLRRTWGCRICGERRKAGKPAEPLPSGLLGPVRVVAVE